jgi:hypothetical protein
LNPALRRLDPFTDRRTEKSSTFRTSLVRFPLVAGLVMFHPALRFSAPPGAVNQKLCVVVEKFLTLPDTAFGREPAVFGACKRDELSLA